MKNLLRVGVVLGLLVWLPLQAGTGEKRALSAGDQDEAKKAKCEGLQTELWSLCEAWAKGDGCNEHPPDKGKVCSFALTDDNEDVGPVCMLMQATKKFGIISPIHEPIEEPAADGGSVPVTCKTKAFKKVIGQYLNLSCKARLKPRDDYSTRVSDRTKSKEIREPGYSSPDRDDSSIQSRGAR